MSKSNSPYSRNDSGAPFVAAVAVTPSDSTILPETDAIYTTGAGNLVLEMDDGNLITIAVGALQYHPMRARRVMAATTATGVIALYRRPLGL